MSYLPSPPAFHSDDDGVTVHQLFLSAQDAPSALDAVRQSLADCGAELCNLSLKPVGQLVEASLRVRRLGDQAARLLARDLAAWPGVNSASVEHQWVRP
ncbi:hypothetical protein CFHF_23380 [Caulobacter flavus]|jgi:hypothetical protein|uniref:Uncharacterized protein n=3 Tax=Caulobacter TaxID=75 RepID=A0A2T9JRD4_9CAUL|nr:MULTISPECIES: hypothetical protein [Caulobacter]AYV44820.1 hypothetical protein C1707_00265 [Caulobacter flavus]MDG2529266.1 hypothetical protein [Caulobacter endophyticus]PLR07160.1 hypothetical protein CFHF_23380 [Caulobacter flavus]PLR20153.1 hypothetical protein SGCZBJ_22015 [Caulobacter zeae]PVM80945.1 hypothetical protein DDF65_13515 [Caulobacter radicis]